MQKPIYREIADEGVGQVEVNKLTCILPRELIQNGRISKLIEPRQVLLIYCTMLNDLTNSGRQ